MTLETGLPAGPQAGSAPPAKGCRDAARFLFACRWRQDPLNDGCSRKVRPRSAFRATARAAGLEAVLINTSGGLTGGDRLRWEIGAAAGSHADAHDAGLREGLPLLAGRGAGLGTHRCRSRWSAGELAAAGDDPLRRRRLERRLDADLAPGVDAAGAGSGHPRAARARRNRSRGPVSRPLAHPARRRADPCRGDMLRRTVRAPISANRRRSAATAPSPRSCWSGDGARDLLDEARDCIAQHDVAGGASAWTIGASGKLLARIAAEGRL